MVLSGTVQVRVQAGGQTFDLSLAVAVNNRGGFSFTAATPLELANGASSPCGSLSITSPPVAGGALGRNCLDQQWTWQSSQIGDGPNKGFQYVTSVTSSNAGIPTTYKYVISPDLENTGSAFYAAQCGNYDPQTNPSGFISGANLLTDTIRHAAGSVASHYASYVSAQNDPQNNVGTVAESFVRFNSGTFSADIDSALNDATQRILSAHATEPCGDCHVMYNASCVFQGWVNYKDAQGNYAPCH